MAITANATTLTFNNGSTQTVAPVNTNANVNSVSAGTGISVSATTGALTVTNAGVTSVNGQTGAVTVSSSSGTVTSVATGNGLQGGTITSTGTLSVACPGFNTVGSYCNGIAKSDVSVGNNYGSWQTYTGYDAEQQLSGFTTLSGTWKMMSAGPSGITCICRVS